MIRKLAISLVLVLIAALGVLAVMPSFASTPDSWTTKAPLPRSIEGSQQAAVLNGRIYIVMSDGSLYAYDPNADAWTKQTTVPLPGNATLDLFGLAACNNKLYIIGDATTSNGQLLYVNEAYDPVTDTCESKMPLSVINGNWQSEVVDGKIYIIGGIDTFIGTIHVLQTNEVYDPANDSWSQAAPVPSPISGYASAVWDNRIYIIGGFDACEYGGMSPAVYSCVNLVQIFDPSTNQWGQGTPMPIAMMSMAAAATTGIYAPQRIYVVGGWENFSFLNYTQIYDPQTGNWSNGSSIRTATRDLCLENVNDKLYAFGGQNSSFAYLTTNLEYTPTGLPKPIASPSPALTSSPSPTTSTIQIENGNGETINLTIAGNVTSSQMSNADFSINHLTNATTLSFTVTGDNGTAGFSNVTIPMSAVPQGGTPVIYIDGQPAPNQGYTQDTNNYYVWYTTHFSTHQVSIVFTTTPNGTPSPTVPELPIWLIPSIFLVAFPLAAILKKRKGQSYE